MSLRRTAEEMLRNITKERNDLVDKLTSIREACEKKIDYLEDKVRGAPNDKTRITAEKELLKERERCVKELEKVSAKIDKLSTNVESRTSKMILASATKKNKKSVAMSLNANALLAKALTNATLNGATKTRKSPRTREQMAANKAIENAERAAKAAAKAQEKAAKEAAAAEEKARKASALATEKATKEAKLAEAKAIKEAKEAEAKALKEATTAAEAVKKVEKAVRAYPMYTKFISNTLKETGTKMKGHNVISFAANFKKTHPNTYNNFKKTMSVNKRRIIAHLLKNKTKKNNSYNPFNNTNNKGYNPFNNNNETKNKKNKSYNPFNNLDF